MTVWEKSSIIENDPGAVGQSLDCLADQIRDGWRQSKKIKFPPTYKKIKQVIFCGMGGSHLGADIVQAVTSDQARVPIIISSDYRLPAWVDRQTLVVCSSYSGTTEETIAAARQAHRLRVTMMVIAGGGPLLGLAHRYHCPVVNFQPSENPSGQPRLGVAYGLMALAALGAKLKWWKISEADIEAMEAAAWAATKRFRNIARAENIAVKLAKVWSRKIPLIIGAEWTTGNIHTMVNQIHENAKTMAAWYCLPETDHHLLEGLRNRKITAQLAILMINDREYAPRNARRLRLTGTMLKKLGATVTEYWPRAGNRWARAAELLALGGYASWYLAAMRRVNPAPVPTVDWLKAQLRRG